MPLGQNAVFVIQSGLPHSRQPFPFPLQYGKICDILNIKRRFYAFRYRTPSYAEDVWDDYYYEKNMQGDIVRVYNSDGVSLVSYVYTAWGEIMLEV